MTQTTAITCHWYSCKWKLMSKSFPNTVVRFQILLASSAGKIVTMFDKSQTCKLVVIFNCKLKSWPHNNSYVTSLDSTNSFRVSSLGLLSSSEAKKIWILCQWNLTTENLLINVVIFISVPLANLEELKILAE